MIPTKIEIGGRLDIVFRQLYKKNNLTIFKHTHTKSRVEHKTMGEINVIIRLGVMRLIREQYKDETN